MATISIRWARRPNASPRSLAKIRGVADLRIAQTQGFPSFDIKFDRNAIARYGLTMEDVADTVAAALGGRPAGLLFSGDRRFQIVVRVPDAERNDLEELGTLPVMLPGAAGSPHEFGALAAVGELRLLGRIERDQPGQRQAAHLRPGQCSRPRHRRPLSTRLKRQSPETCGSPLAHGWNGAANSRILQQAIGRLEFVVPVCMVLIFGALYMALGSVPLTLVVFTAVPLALAGGIFPIALRGIPFSVSAAVGFIAVSGVAVLNGLVLMASIGAAWQWAEDSDGDLQRHPRTGAAGADDGARGVARFCPDGDRHRNRRRGAKAAGDGRHRRAHYVDGADTVPAACRLRSCCAAGAPRVRPKS